MLKDLVALKISNLYLLEAETFKKVCITNVLIKKRIEEICEHKIISLNNTCSKIK